MGEARIRKINDPNFGRVPKKQSIRGLVVSPPVRIEGTTAEFRGVRLDPQELRFSLLFWDRLVWPRTRLIHVEGDPEEQFLQAAGILTRPEYNFSGDQAQALLRAQIQAYQDRESVEPGSWALAQGENSLSWIDERFSDQGAGSSIELHRAVPVPKHDVPLAEILEFKHRRHDELILLRSHLESFVAEIEAAPDRSVALQMRAAQIDQACANLLAVGREWQFPVYLSNFKASFGFSPLKFLPAAAGGWQMGTPYGLVAATAIAATAGAVSTLEIKADYALRSMRRPKSPYRYAFHMNEELR